MDSLSTRYNDHDVLGGTGLDDKVEVSWLNFFDHRERNFDLARCEPLGLDWFSRVELMIT
jgi:hypothetical protein